ncbi:MAG: hypothetical protein RL693_677 [Verrucomicrobiota bacterium]|jgi:hypothetical protein
MFRSTSIALLPCLTAACCLFLSHALPAHEAAQQMVDTANAFLTSLPDESKAKAQFALTDEERLNWHFIPRERKGLPIKEMSQDQRLLAHALLNTGLSYRGYIKASTIMSLEEVLYTIEGAGDEPKREAARLKRDPERYFFSIFGEPSMTGTWGWRVEGHHLSLNFTIKDGQLMRATPSFFGSNPGEVRVGNRSGLRVLGQEEDLGRKLVKSLDEAQLKKALINETAPKEMLTEAKRTVTPLTPDGISDADLNSEQKTMLQQIIREFLFRIRPDIAEESWQEILSSGPVHFAWAGGREPKQPHYYSVQGKTFLLEYDNTQNDANHVHTVWRDFDSDFGADLLGEHVKASH